MIVPVFLLMAVPFILNKSVNHYMLHLSGIIAGYMLVMGCMNVVNDWYWTMCFYMNMLYVCIRNIEDSSRDVFVRQHFVSSRGRGSTNNNNSSSSSSSSRIHESVMLDDDDDFGRWYDREMERREQRESLIGDNNDNDDIEQGVYNSTNVNIDAHTSRSAGGDGDDGDDDNDVEVVTQWDITHTDMISTP